MVGYIKEIKNNMYAIYVLGVTQVKCMSAIYVLGVTKVNSTKHLIPASLPWYLCLIVNFPSNIYKSEKQFCNRSIGIYLARLHN